MSGGREQNLESADESAASLSRALWPGNELGSSKDMLRRKFSSDLVSKLGHAFAMLLDELLALARRLSVLFDAVAKLEEAFVSRRLGLGAGTAAVFAEQFQIVSLPYHQRIIVNARLLTA
jgi:hypothetical protein